VDSNAEEVYMEANMKASAPDQVSVEDLVANLWSPDGVVRQHARRDLVTIGQPAVPALIEALSAGDQYVRWEAAKALGQIADPVAAPALVAALDDRDGAVRWLAAKGLIAIGCASLEPLMRALEQHPESVWLREGAHHVLHDLNHGQASVQIAPVLDALHGIQPRMVVPWEARAARVDFAASDPCSDEEERVAEAEMAQL
jgi:hypothetical protein